ncbi:Second Messenger Oligonucleotide or Dinucleotide Synthetase domain protein [compost metagenome]
MTLLQCINEFIDKISVTDRQEEGIKTSLDNIYSYLLDKDNSLFVERTFTNGSYDRDTIIRPLNDIDIFAVLKKADWQDEFGQLPNPQKVLTKIKNYLNDQPVYEGKVNQDRPCVTLHLSDKDFDILPSFEQTGGGYLIPNYDLKSWIFTYPEQLYNNLESVHRLRGYKVKQVIKAIKYWNRDNNKIIPSFHIEESAINIFQINDFKNFAVGISLWFENAEYNLYSSKFNCNDDYLAAIDLVKNVNEKLKDALKKHEAGEKAECIKIWKGIFGRDFPTIDINEAKSFSDALKQGSLAASSTGFLSTASRAMSTPSKGYYGDISEN